MKKALKFAASHDEYPIFTIVYVVIAVILAVFFGLFYFFLWVLFHFILEVYENHIKKDPLHINFIRSTKECLFDIMFLFIGVSIDIIFHFSAALAAGRSLGGIARFIKIIPRLMGIKSAAEGTAHILVAFMHHSKKEEEPQENPPLVFSKWDFSAVIISVIFVFLAFYIPMSLGLGVNDVISAGIAAFDPYDIKGFEVFNLGGEEPGAEHTGNTENTEK